MENFTRIKRLLYGQFGMIKIRKNNTVFFLLSSFENIMKLKSSGYGHFMISRQINFTLDYTKG